VLTLLFTCLSPDTNSPLNTVFILILSCFRITLCTRSSSISLASSRNWRGSVWPEFIKASIYGFRTLYQSRAIEVPRYTRHSLAQNIRAQYLSNFWVSRAINDCLTTIDNRERLARLCSFSDSMKLSQRYCHTRNSSRVFNWAVCAIRLHSVIHIKIFDPY